MTDTTDFVAIDLETANRWGAICSVGVAMFKDGELTDEWQSFVDPEVEFDDNFVEIHGINEESVDGAPNFTKVMEEVERRINDNVVVAHNSHFDRRAMESEAERWGRRIPDIAWLDTLDVSRSIWPDLPNHRLTTVCRHIGHDFEHSNALDDAKAAGHVFLEAMKETGKDLHEMTKLAVDLGSIIRTDVSVVGQAIDRYNKFVTQH